MNQDLPSRPMVLDKTNQLPLETVKFLLKLMDLPNIIATTGHYVMQENLWCFDFIYFA